MKKTIQLVALMAIAVMTASTFTACKKKGCTDITASNYDSDANKDDGSCTYITGCTDPKADNYVSNATKSDGSCTYPTINLNSVTGDGDVTGGGGTATASTTWSNSATKGEYSMDITSSNGGTFNLTVKDAAGTTVLNETLTAGIGDDSKSGLTSAGTAGTWTITITLTNFNGDGSYSVDPA